MKVTARLDGREENIAENKIPVDAYKLIGAFYGILMGISGGKKRNMELKIEDNDTYFIVGMKVNE